MIQNYKKYWFAGVFLLILSVGIFLRTYNFESWLFFQGDQARDAFLVSKAVEEGPGWLPLLGPKAGGTYLRLGPIFYYFEYISTFIFGTESPAVMAYPDLFFSIATLVLLYFFLKELFPKSWALALVAGYSVCYFAIQYSRFAWNPNSLPFFNLLFFYSLFKFFNAEEKKAKILWSILLGISYAVASQLHFVSFLVLPLAIVFVFVVQKYYFKKIIIGHAKYLGIIFLIFLFSYVPVILSDISTQGNNSLNFLNSIGKKSSDMGIMTLMQKNYFNFSKYFLTILGGLVNVPKNIINWFGLVMITGTISGGIVFAKEKDAKKKFILVLIFVWFFSYFLTYISLAAKLQPRHFLVILPIPFIFLGLIAYAVERSFKSRYKLIVPILLFSIPILANAHSMKTWFSEMGDSQISVTTPRKSAILKSIQGESWWHLEKTSQFISDDCDKEKITIIPPKEVYRSLFDYTLQNIGENREYSIQWGSMNVSDEECYYFVYFSKNNYYDRFGKQIKEVNSQFFGDLSVVRFAFDEENLSGEKRISNPFKKKKSVKEEKAQQEREEDDSESEEATPAESGDGGIIQSIGNMGNPGREPRVFWGDLFN